MYFEFLDKGTLHDDLIFRIGDEEVVSDSYYFALDKSNQDKQESSTKVRRVLCLLIEQWIELLETANEGEVLSLPFGFDDQSTGCLKCSIFPGKVSLEIGYSDVEGWSFYPSDIREFAKTSISFTRVNDKVITLDKKTFIQQLGKNLNTI